MTRTMTGSRPALTSRFSPIWVGGLAVVVIALLVFGSRLAAEPPFVDEWAYVSQAYYADKFSQPNDTAWLDYPAYDLPPLTKYLVGISLKLAGFRPPSPAAAQLWYANTHSTFGPSAMLLAARRPVVVFGALGCLAVFALGTLAADRWVGLVAANLLLIDPLYRMLSRRAMSDVPAEALLFAATAVGLWGWRGLLEREWGPLRAIAAFACAGLLAGLATLSKLNGVLGLIVLSIWIGPTMLIPGRAWSLRLLLAGGWVVAAVAAFGTFIALNPFLTAHPAGPLPEPIRSIAGQSLAERCWFLLQHRIEVPRSQQELFPHNALRTPGAKLGAMAVQGFGRFGVLGSRRYDPAHGWWFDSTLRYDWEQDRGALLWLPWVAAGAVGMVLRGYRQRTEGRAPTAWALLAQVLVTLVVVTAFLPLAWDRFFLSVQAGSCLLAASVAVGGIRTLARYWRRERQPEFSP